MRSRACDPVDDEAMAGRAVEQHEQPGEEEQQRDEQSEQLIEQPPRPVRPKRACGGSSSPVGVDDHVGHQKAWPSETVTATGPSPFCRLSGTPTSMRIGPKLE